jgi:hypothetical protein
VLRSNLDMLDQTEKGLAYFGGLSDEEKSFISVNVINRETLLKGRLSTINLLVPNCLDQLLFILK